MSIDNLGEKWEDNVDRFVQRMFEGTSLDENLFEFVKECQDEDSEDEQEMGCETDDYVIDYVDRSVKPLCVQIAQLQKENTELRMRMTDLEFQKSRVYQPNVGVPTWPPINKDYSLDWYKVTAHDNKGLLPEGFATSGYMQVIDEKYTPEQIEEWSKIRYTPQ